MKPESIRQFAKAVQRTLQSANIHPRGVLIRRLVEHRTSSSQRRRYLASSSSLEPVCIPTLVDSRDHREQANTLSQHDLGSKAEAAHGVVKASKRTHPLPTSCPGCGALAQEVDTKEAGHYSRSRKAVRAYFAALKVNQALDNARESFGYDQLGEISLDKRTDEHGDEDIGLEESTVNTQTLKTTTAIPVCDRCHDLIHNSRGTSVAHPSIEDIADSIAESPFKRNHVYHVLDAADFPMSLIPSIYSRLQIAKPRGQNRRSQHSFTRKPTLSFLITRSDLLGPTKDMVDGLMPYFQSVLRAALGRFGDGMRLGNVHLVSAKRGWWTKDIKDSIWERGGGNWMVGKFNVGKSNLFEVLFPKGSGERAPVYSELAREQIEENAQAQELLSESSLLPPVQPESPFPILPLVSSLPGTTASPIRLPFGNSKGELIDLPGLERGNLDEHVLPEHKLDLVMTHRPNVVQHNIKPGQSLLLGGGLIRITPHLDEYDPSTIMLAYPFVPIEAHVTSTEKAVATQLQESESGIKTILSEDAGKRSQSAGMVTLDTDVTKRSAGPLLRAGVPLSRLSFQIYSTDLLIEGVGWVELVCQVRRRRQSSQPSTAATSEGLKLRSETRFSPFTPGLATVAMGETQNVFPQVEVFTPDGKHVSQRKPMGAWVLWNEGKKTSTAVRPRKSMKGVKKQEKQARRASAVLA